MEGGGHDLENNSEANGTNKPVVDSYKSIPDEDANWKDRKEDSTVDIKMGKPETEEIDDGAKEKMLSEEVKISPKKDVSQVIFISENGDAKVDVTPKVASLSGMNKEELMKYANDPFWIRLRWFLFIGFWLLWLAMLLGAVAIIIVAPKCTRPTPKTWWEKSPIVQLEPKDLESKDTTALANLLDTLNAQHISVISLSSILKSTSPGHVTNFTDVDPKIGLDSIKSLIKLAKDRGQKVVLEIDPNHSGIDHFWFNSSLHRVEPYTDYYVWRKPQSDADNNEAVPNNWLSIYGKSAWEMIPQRGEYYLHQFDKSQPDLNFNNPLVVDEFNKIFNHWLELGISGFRLGFTQHLIEDPEFKDEGMSRTPGDPEEYESLSHVKTKDWDDNMKVLREWRNTVVNQTQGHRLFTLRDDTAPATLAMFKENHLVNMPQQSMFLMNANEGITAETLRNGVTLALNKEEKFNGSWPTWDLNGRERALRDRMPKDVADSITLMSLLLPGTPVLKLNDTTSAGSAFKTLAEKRKEDIFLHGDFHCEIVNGTVFVYTRLKSGLPGYLVAYQSSEFPAVIDLSRVPEVPEEVNVLTYSPNYAKKGQPSETKFSSREVPIAPKSTLVLTFVPWKEEE